MLFGVSYRLVWNKIGVYVEYSIKNDLTDINL